MTDLAMAFLELVLALELALQFFNHLIIQDRSSNGRRRRAWRGGAGTDSPGLAGLVELPPSGAALDGQEAHEKG